MSKLDIIAKEVMELAEQGKVVCVFLGDRTIIIEPIDKETKG